ncbi:MAG: NAD(P)/FAD-dependent oxidoreductase [Candidatus Aenigmarchaeota archaeon]|nr:NAD(P)/FAD-dependent oxidoreductase [Candidatus Aenigmarchaeota archaeon]
MAVRDITIVGAGPAGLITGLKLLEAGFTPTILDKQQEIVSTLCGEGLSADALARVPFQDWSAYAPQEFSHATFIFPNGTRAYAQKKCYTMDRTSWFRAMAAEFEQRGGELRLGTKVERVADLKADLIIGADGPFSLVGKAVGNRMEHIGGVQYRVRSSYAFDGMEFFIDKRYSPEYSWIFAKGKTLNVGLLGRQKDLEKFIADRALPDLEILKKEAYNIPFFGTKIQEGNLVLTGDAAGVTNPLTKGGMAACIHVAEILVDCVLRDKVGEYQQRVFSHPVMAPEYREALRYFREIDNSSLDKAGAMLNGRDLAHLDRATKLKIVVGGLTHPRKMRTLMKASSYANKYSW